MHSLFPPPPQTSPALFAVILLGQKYNYEALQYVIFSSLPRTSFVLCSYFSSVPCPRITSVWVCSSYMKDRVSHPYKNNSYNYNNKFCSVIKVWVCRLLRNLDNCTKLQGVTFQWIAIIQYMLQAAIPRALRRGIAGARFFGLWVRIPPGTWMCVVSVVCCECCLLWVLCVVIVVCCECCVLWGRGPCDELITPAEESYWVWCVWV